MASPASTQATETSPDIFLNGVTSQSTASNGTAALPGLPQALSPVPDCAGTERAWEVTSAMNFSDLSRLALTSPSWEAGETPLHQAVKQKNVEMVQLLLEYGSNVAAQNSEGMTLLHLAALQGSTEILHELVKAMSESRYELAILDHYGRTALHCAVISDCAQAAKIILDAGADVNAVRN